MDMIDSSTSMGENGPTTQNKDPYGLLKMEAKDHKKGEKRRGE
jgi:hypothetical protein